MSAFQLFKSRPWLAAAAALAVVAAIAVGVPISYERVTGHDVSLALAGSVDPMRVPGIAREFKSLLRAEGVQVTAEASQGGASFHMSARVAANAGRVAEATARAYAERLSHQGITAAVASTPHKERVSSSMVAYALDRVIQISLDGKSAAQLEAEIKQRLADAGITDAQVSVTESNDGADKKLKLQVEAKRDLQNPPSTGEAEMPQLVLTKDGQPVDGKGFTVRVAKKRSESGTTLEVRCQQDGKTAVATVANTESMGNDALAAEIQRQLRAAGLDVDVNVPATGGIEVKPHTQP